MISGVHSGDIGDVIYGIPAFRSAGIERIILSPAPTWGTNMGKDACASLRPLLESQGFVVDICSGEMSYRGGDVLRLLDSFRNGLQDLTWTHLSLSQAKELRVDVDLSSKYLDVEPKHVADVVVHRSHRYHNPWFAWQMITRDVDDIVAVGLPDEVASLSMACGKNLTFCQTPTFLDLAQVIAGAKVFIGNQSSPFAIAEGLKINRIQETNFGVPNALPQTHNGLGVQVMEQLIAARLQLHKWLSNDTKR